MSDLNDKLPQIPGIMRKLNWPVAAALMDRWFAGPASNDRSRQAPDTTDVTMAWALSFDRAKKVYDQLIQDRVWSNYKAQIEIGNMLRSKRLMSTGPVPFGHLDSPVTLVNKDYINERPVLSSPFFDPLDDMFGALGSFNFRVAIEGVVTPVKPSGHEITINRIGIYVQDKYDYEGDQVLGFWKFDDGGNVSKIPLWNYHEVSNGSFRDYRAANHHGGDFWVFSDVRILKLHPPDRFMAKI